MLQRAQLKAVVDRYPEPVAELRRFLVDAGISPGTLGSFTRLVEKLQQDRSFHRDLTSHVWIVLHDSRGAIHYADLLGILAVAAAGLSAATDANEHDAHALLGFLIAAGDELAETQRGRLSSAGVTAPVSPAAAVRTTRDPELTHPAARKARFRLVGVIVCVLALLAGGYGLLWSMHSGKTPAQPVPEIASNSASSRPDATRAQSPSGGTPAADKVPGRHSVFTSTRPAAAERAGTTVRDSVIGGEISRGASPGVTPGGTLSMRMQPAEIVRVPPSTSAVPDRAVGGGAASPAPGARAVRPLATVPAPIPASVLSRRLDSPAPANYSNDPDVTAAGRPYPRLHRRSGALRDDPTLLAEMNAPNLAAPPGSTGGGVKGVVRSTCLGMMAGNLLYSPSPAYPPVAAAAHVSGEVRVQATIDRDGAVSAARVVSGPPLLRDAALSAVEQWRYKPFTSGGKPLPTGTLAVVEFQLP